MYSAKAVANWFVEQGLKENKPIDLLKLIKLVYVAQGISLAIDKPLFNEHIKAWAYGPVVESVYHAFKENKSEQIVAPATEGYWSPEKGSYAEVPEVSATDKNAEEILETTWKTFGNWSGVQLSNWSHEEDSPWYKEWYENDGQFNRSHSMSNEIIAQYFKKIVGQHDS